MPTGEKALSPDEINMLFAIINQLSIFLERELFRQRGRI
jgi:hypothetical protein